MRSDSGHVATGLDGRCRRRIAVPAPIEIAVERQPRGDAACCEAFRSPSRVMASSPSEASAFQPARERPRKRQAASVAMYTKQGLDVAAKPKEHHVQMLLSRHIDGTVDERKIKLPLSRLHQFPIGWHKQRIQTQRLHSWHHLVDIFHRRRRRVAQLATEDRTRQIR